MKRKSRTYIVNTEFIQRPDVGKKLAELYDLLLAMPSDEQLTPADTTYQMDSDNTCNGQPFIINIPPKEEKARAS